MKRHKAQTPRIELGDRKTPGFPVAATNWYAQYEDDNHRWQTIAGPGIWKPIYKALLNWKTKHADELTGTCDTETRMTLA